MIKRINFTGRRKLLREDVQFFVKQVPGCVPTFRAALDFDSYELPADAQVFLEAYRQTSWQRVRAGTVGALDNLGEHELAEFSDTDSVLFRVRVISADGLHCLMLAEADRIAGGGLEQHEDGREPLLPVRCADLGPEVWRLDMSGDPELLVNKRIGETWREVAKHPAFISLVYPTALRCILLRIAGVSGEPPDPDDPNSWESRWMRFALSLPGVRVLKSTDDENDREEWVTAAVEAWCRQLRMFERFEGFLAKETAG